MVAPGNIDQYMFSTHAGNSEFESRTVPTGDDARVSSHFAAISLSAEPASDHCIPVAALRSQPPPIIDSQFESGPGG